VTVDTNDSSDVIFKFDALTPVRNKQGPSLAMQ